MTQTTRPKTIPFPWLMFLVAVALGLTLLVGCRAEDGVEGGVTVVDRAIFWAEVEAIMTDAGCANCHLPDAPDVATSCEPCHVGYLPSSAATLDELGMISVTSTATTSGVDIIVDPGSSGSSTLWWAISGDAQYDGGMKTSMTTLTPDEKGIIKAWIDQGAIP